MEHVNIPIPGPSIEVIGGSDKAHDAARKLEAKRQNALLAAELTKSPSWPWFVAQCRAKASLYEVALTGAERELSPREEDRHRGRIEAYRSMPRVIQEAQVAYERAAKLANKKGTPAS